MGAVTESPLAGLRADFPVLEREINGHSLVYLDSAASSQKPRQVIEAMERFYSHSYGTVHRGVYELGREATELFEGARERIAAFVGWDTDCSIFTRNATEAINLVAYAWGRGNVGPGDEVLITEMEHHSNIVPWQLLCEDTGARLRYLSVPEGGELSLDELDSVLAEGRVKLVAVGHVSNVLGTINPVEEIARRARAAGALTLVDGAQAVPQMPVDLRAIDADFYAWTGHKALGPTVGLLHGRRELLKEMRPFLGGGHMISRVEREHSTWNELPWKFEAGTNAIAEAIGLGAAVDYLPPPGWRTCARTSASSPPTRSSGCPRSTGSPSTAPPTRTGAAGWCRSRSRGCTRTTSRSCATARRSAFAPATTAPSRSCACSAWAPRRAPPSTSTTRATTWTGWCTRCTARARSSGWA